MHDITAKLPPFDCNLIVQLLNEALNVLEVDGIEAKRHILHARALVLEPTRTSSVARGSLAGWQMRRVANFVHFNLSTRLRIEQVAQALKVSPGYLSRAFKATAGITYSEFVLRARIELAKRLLLTTETPISEIALTCGLTDQSHLTRIFKRSVGMPPAAWRRQLGHCVEVDLSNPEGEVDTLGQGLMNVIVGGADGTCGFEDQRLRPGDIFIFQKTDRSADAATSIWDQLEVVVAVPNGQTHKRRMVCKQLPPIDLANEPDSDSERDSESR